MSEIIRDLEVSVDNDKLQRPYERPHIGGNGLCLTCSPVSLCWTPLSQYVRLRYI